jgi:hypothetical protein
MARLNLLFLGKNKMKFEFKFKNKKPLLKSARPPIFDTNFYWFASLILCFVVFIITAVVGFNLFYSQYYETYKKAEPVEDFGNLINVEELKSAVEKRNALINQKIPLSRDPSL